MCAGGVCACSSPFFLLSSLFFLLTPSLAYPQPLHLKIPRYCGHKQATKSFNSGCLAPW